MKYILSGTNRKNSHSLRVAAFVRDIYRELGEDVEVMDLCKIPLVYKDGQDYSGPHPEELQTYIEKVNKSEALIIVCPEYNGSYPGSLKFFIDHWTYPLSFEFRPVCFIGLGGKFGGLRPVEHLQQVFGYRNSYIFPQRVFLFNIEATMKDGGVNDPSAVELLRTQAQNFQRFVRGLITERLDANSQRSSG